MSARLGDYLDVDEGIAMVRVTQTTPCLTCRFLGTPHCPVCVVADSSGPVQFQCWTRRTLRDQLHELRHRDVSAHELRREMAEGAAFNVRQGYTDGGR